MTLTKNSKYIPKFKKSFFHPRNWSTWLALSLFSVIALLPARIHDPLLGMLGRIAGKFSKSARRRARINLFYCFPTKSVAEREAIIDAMYTTAPQAMAMMAELAFRGPKKVIPRIEWDGLEIIEEMRRLGEKVIFLVPHSWGVDIPAMLMASQGQKIAAMFHNQGNRIFDYVWNTVRRRFGGRLHARIHGIKPFIQSVRQGYWGYYLSDQDYGPKKSEFVDFFSTYKATIPAIGRLMKMCHARIIPLFPVYNGQTHRLTINVRPPMDDLLTADHYTIARRMNEEVEILVKPHTEQYTWILKFLKTRKPGEQEPYKRTELF